MNTIPEALHRLAQDPNGTLALGDETGTMVAVMMTPKVHAELLRAAGLKVSDMEEQPRKRPRKTRGQRKAAARIREREEKGKREALRAQRRQAHESNRRLKLQRKMPGTGPFIPTGTYSLPVTYR